MRRGCAECASTAADELAAARAAWHDRSMARIEERLSENAEGDLYVDRSCIDCAVCRVVAPATFARSERAGASFVARQPEDEASRLRAKMALVACPVNAIGARRKLPLADAVLAFPEPLGDGVHFCGFASERSYGAQSYLVVRPDGNVLVDSPRATPRLFERIAALGGVRWMFLTHKDDVADHAKFARRFGCTRVMHAADVTHDTQGVERVIAGRSPVSLAPDLLVIPVPGHTRGSAALLYRDLALFTGDHLFATEDGAELYAARSVCWYSWAEQKRSIAALLEHDYRWILPGHEGRMRARTASQMRERTRAALASTP
jgi:glyoxylase-like metal-dependent hydrolase (beta-lactamase superfamily II)/ferredoxin